jgi:predicted DNA-binding WGR domain protein
MRGTPPLYEKVERRAGRLMHTREVRTGLEPRNRSLTRIYLERHDPARNMARFYSLTVTPTLFGEWALIREWGRIGSPGTVRELWFKTEAEAVDERRKLSRLKEKRGYVRLMPGEPK